VTVFIREDATGRSVLRVLFSSFLFFSMWPVRFTFDTLRNVFGFASKFFSISEFVSYLAVNCWLIIM